MFSTKKQTPKELYCIFEIFFFGLIILCLGIFHLPGHLFLHYSFGFCVFMGFLCVPVSLCMHVLLMPFLCFVFAFISSVVLFYSCLFILFGWFYSKEKEKEVMELNG